MYKQQSNHRAANSKSSSTNLFALLALEDEDDDEEEVEQNQEDDAVVEETGGPPIEETSTALTTEPIPNEDHSELDEFTAVKSKKKKNLESTREDQTRQNHRQIIDLQTKWKRRGTVHRESIKNRL